MTSSVDARPLWRRQLDSRWVRRALWALGGLLALWAIGWAGLPPLLKWQGEKIASAQLGRTVRIGAVDFKPWTLELTLRDVAVAGVDGAPDQFSVQRVYADAELQSIFRLAPVIDAIQIEAPMLRLTHLGQGRYDVDDILARLAARPQPAEPGEPVRLALHNIVLEGGSVDFDDRAVGRQHQVRDLRLALPFISTLASARQIKVQPQLALVVNGSAFDSRAQALPFDATTYQTGAVLRLSRLDLAPYLDYLPAGLPIRLKGGVVDADVRLGFAQVGDQPTLRLAGTLALHGLQAADAQGADALAWDALKIELGDVRPLQRRVHLAAVELDGPRLLLRRDAAGRINLLPAQAPPDSPEKIAAGAASAPAQAASDAKSDAKMAAAPGWQLLVDKLTLRGGSVEVSDAAAAPGAPPARLQLSRVELAAETLGYPLARPLRFRGSVALAGAAGLTPAIADAPPPTRAGRAPARAAAAPAATVAAAAASAPRDALPSIEFEGQADASGAELTARAAGLPLALAGPYLRPYLVPRLTGALDAQFGLQWAPAPARELPPDLKVAVERLTLRQLMLTGAPDADTADPDADAPAPAPPAAPRPARDDGALASIAQLELSDARLDWRGRALTLGRLVVESPRLALARQADGRLSAQDWLRAAAAPVDPAAPAPHPPRPRSAAPAEPPWTLLLAELALRGGSLGWRDAATPRPVRAELTQLQIDAQQIDLNSGQPVPLSLSARLGAGRAEPGRLAWRGNVGWQPTVSAQGQIDAERLPVHAFEPYFGELLNVDVLRADTSFKGQLVFAQTAQGARARVSGDASVQELRTHSRPGSAADDRASVDAPAAAVRGSSAALAPDAAATRRAGGLGEELLSFKQLRLAGLDVQLEPGKPTQVEVKDTALTDFYARLIVHPDGRINLQDVLKSSADTVAAAPAAPTAAPPRARAAPSRQPAAGESSGDDATDSVAAGAISALAAAPKTVQVDPNAPIVRVGPVRLGNGRVAFSDRFIRPNYSADLSELNGTLSAFSSVAPAGAPQMAELTLTGRVEGTAALEVTGQLNPLAKPLALDIRGKVRDLELPPLSPYAVKYAGHGIERGKLSMDVAYAVQPDGRLTATNQLVLNQLSFGEPVPGAPASLPVKLATALLADSKGVIDLDLPISGSLNDPQFSLGAVIVKAFVNLIGKVITAPFSLLARALGGGAGDDDLSSVAFAPGSARLQPAARRQLDQVAKALADRPQLKLTVVGTARLTSERDGYQRQRLLAMLAAEKRAAAVTASASGPAPAASAPAASDPVDATESIAGSAESTLAGGQNDAEISAADADYPRLLRRLYRRADLPGKPRNAIGLQRDIDVPEMEALLMAQIEVTDDAMRQLALARGVAVKDYLAARQLPAERLFLGAPRVGEAAAPPGAASAPDPAASAPSASAWSPRAELALTAR